MARRRSRATAALGVTILVLFFALLLAGSSSVTVRDRGDASSTVGASGPELAGRLPGEPMDVLFLVPSAGESRVLLARFYQVENPAGRIAIFDLDVEGSGESFLPGGCRSPITGLPDYRLLTDRVEAATGVRIHHLVVVKENPFPQDAGELAALANPLLRLAAAFPGRLTVSVPPSPGIPANSFASSFETGCGLQWRRLLELLGKIESARKGVRLDIVSFDGTRKIPDMERVSHDESGVDWIAGLNPPQPAGLAGNDETLRTSKFEGNCLVTFDTANLRGSLPPAVPVEVIRRGNPNLARVAITIDDGWNADMRIFDLLKGFGVKWTAFLVGRGVTESNPDFTRRVCESGGEVLNHTYSHHVMRGVTEPQFTDDIWRNQRYITDVTYKVYPYLRFSGGAFDQEVVNWASREGFWVVNWTIDSLDTNKNVSLEERVNHVLSRVEPGAILLCHFGGYGTFDILSRVIPQIQKRGFEVTSLTDTLEGTPFRLDR